MLDEYFLAFMAFFFPAAYTDGAHRALFTMPEPTAWAAPPLLPDRPISHPEGSAISRGPKRCAVHTLLAT